MSTIRITSTREFSDRSEIVVMSVIKNSLGEACKKWLADNPVEKTVRELGLRVSLEFRSGYWYSMAHNGCEVISGMKKQDPVDALEWIMNLKVPEWMTKRIET